MDTKKKNVVDDPYFRTESDVLRSGKDIKHDYLVSAAFWAVLIVPLALAAFLYSNIPATVALLLLVIVIWARSWMAYRAAKQANAETLGVRFTPELVYGKSRGEKLCRDLCHKIGIKPPSFGYTLYGFDGVYDPNKGVIALGQQLALFETENSLVTSLHEVSHHILLNDPVHGERRKMILRLAGKCRTLGKVFVIAFLVSFFLGAQPAFTSWMFAGFLISSLIFRAGRTTSEYDANRYAAYLLDQDMEELSGITDKEAALKNLAMGERTYTVDLIGWMVICVTLSLFPVI